MRPAEHGEQSVAVDWAYVGRGAVGEELGTLVGASLAFFEADPTAAEALEAHCLRGYLTGLDAAGWHGDRVDVRFGYLATLALRFSVGALVPVLTIALDEGMHRWAEQVMGRPIDVFIRNVRATMEFQEQRIVEARRLLASR